MSVVRIMIATLTPQRTFSRWGISVSQEESPTKIFDLVEGGCQFACFRDNVGSNVAFHGKGWRGYFTDLDKAEVLSREEAQRRWMLGRDFEQPISADHVDALSVLKVDFRHIPDPDDVDPNSLEWVAFKNRTFDGNDLYWITEDGSLSLDFSLVKRFSLAEVKLSEYYTYLPFQDVDKVKRRTFSIKDFNARKMVQGAGIVIPEHIKKERKRKPSAKVRVNCQSCGRINWQLNPYDLEGCKAIAACEM